jgi:hypothetical protein
MAGMNKPQVNIGELIADESACDQPCRFGNRVEGHAVYCHNDAWEDSPRKCRRTWYTGGEVKDEDCPGFQANPDFKGTVSPTPLAGSPCAACGGSRIKPTDRGTVATCERCVGEGVEPGPAKLTSFQEDALSSGMGHSGRHSGQYERYVVMAKTREQGSDVCQLADSGHVELHSMSFADGVTAFLLTLTGKGDATMRANWKARKS